MRRSPLLGRHRPRTSGTHGESTGGSACYDSFCCLRPQELSSSTITIESGFQGGDVFRCCRRNNEPFARQNPTLRRRSASGVADERQANISPAGRKQFDMPQIEFASLSVHTTVTALRNDQYVVVFATASHATFPTQSQWPGSRRLRKREAIEPAHEDRSAQSESLGWMPNALNKVRARLSASAMAHCEFGGRAAMFF